MVWYWSEARLRGDLLVARLQRGRMCSSRDAVSTLPLVETLVRIVTCDPTELQTPGSSLLLLLHRETQKSSESWE